MGRLLQRILRIRLSRILLGLGLFHPRILSSDPTALTTIHTFLSAAIFKFKKSKFDDRNYCVNIHQNWDLSAKFFIKSSAIVLQLYYIQIVLPGKKISKIQFVILNLKKAKTLSQKLKEINCKNIQNLKVVTLIYYLLCKVGKFFKKY